MIKWKLYKTDLELIKQVTNVTNYPVPNWLEKLEDEKETPFGLLIKARKLMAKWSLEKAQPIHMNFGLDLEKELTEALSKEIRDELDKELLKAMLLPGQEQGDKL